MHLLGVEAGINDRPAPDEIAVSLPLRGPGVMDPLRELVSSKKGPQSRHGVGGKVLTIHPREGPEAPTAVATAIEDRHPAVPHDEAPKATEAPDPRTRNPLFWGCRFRGVASLDSVHVSVRFRRPEGGIVVRKAVGKTV